MNESIGALWLKEGNKGKFMSGVITIDGVTHNIVVFKNTLKQEGERTPDYRILPSRKPNEQAAEIKEDIGF